MLNLCKTYVRVTVVSRWGRSLPRSYRASNEGFKKAEAAFKLKGWTQDHLAGRADCSRSVVINFFARRRVEKRLFEAICNELGLEWGTVADFEAEEQLSGSSMDAAQEKTTGSIPEESDTTQMLTNEKRYAFAIAGSVDQDDIAKLKAIAALLKDLAKDTSIKIIDIESGSIKLILEGSQEGLEQLEALFKLGELKEVLGIPVEDVKFVAVGTSNADKKRLAFTIAGNVTEADIAKLKAALIETSDDNENTEDDESRPDQDNAVQKSSSQSQILSGNPIGVKFILTNLISGNLNGAFRILTNLIRANLSGANLSGANLSSANLSYAYLSYAYLSDADLSNANLSYANLSGVNLSGAIVEHALFGGSVGLSEDMKRDLEQRGAIFGDRPPVPTPN